MDRSDNFYSKILQIYDTKAEAAAAFKDNDWIDDWVDGFVQTMGLETAKHLLAEYYI